jgi:hypothetical protein
MTILQECGGGEKDRFNATARGKELIIALEAG